MPAIGSCSSAPANPLLGSWKFTTTNNKFGAKGCSQAYVFRDKTATITYADNETMRGAVKTMDVTYVPSPTVVFVMTNAAGHVNYNIVDANHMYLEDAWGRCNYERTN